MKPYKKYVPSGVEWIGDIPEGWRMSKIGYFYDIQLGKMLTPNPSSDMDELSDYLCSVNVDFAGVKTEVVKQMWISPNETQKYRLAKGDLIVAEGGDAGVCCFWNNELSTCYIQNAVHRVRSIKREKVTFLYYWLYTLKKTGYIDLICNKATIAHLTREKFSDCPIVLPDPDTQTSIVDYLDRETARIDNIIKAKEMLIERLKEKRTAVITHAVTKGLDPKAKMKPSGVDWIGDIPEGWEVKKIKYIAQNSLMYGANESPDDFDETQPRYIRITDIDENGKLRDDIAVSLDIEKAKPYLLKKDDILFARSGATVGKSYIFSQDILACFAGYMIKFEPKKTKSVPKFAYYITSSKMYLNWIESNTIQATIQNVSAEKYNNFYLPLPRVELQNEIVNFLDAETSKLDTTIEKTKLSIKKLKEYRTALISACVTGKIDVRSEV